MAAARPVRLALTIGDPCGIGPEVLLKALATMPGSARLIVIGDADLCGRLASRLRLRIPAWMRRPLSARRAADIERSCFLHIPSRGTLTPGRSSAAAGAASLAYLDEAIRLARRRVIDGLVTAPVTKWAMDRVQPGFSGQTEYLAGKLRATFPVMLFTSDRLRVVLLTRHRALREVPRIVTRPMLERTIETTLYGLRHSFGLRNPSMVVCGLNPHAGEGGLFGDEETRLLAPVLRRLKRRGVRVDGPVAADGYFASKARHDVVLCWYHDQGLIPFKMRARDEGCQVTLGLPIPRTSPDHGSALDIAGRGIADAGSMRYAIRTALMLSARARR